jgi:hypothetical protein
MWPRCRSQNVLVVVTWQRRSVGTSGHGGTGDQCLPRYVNVAVAVLFKCSSLAVTGG